MKLRVKIGIAVVALIAVVAMTFVGCSNKTTVKDFVQPTLSANLVEGATIMRDPTINKDVEVKEDKTAINILQDDSKNWSAKVQKFAPTSVCIELKNKVQFNTVVIKEVGNNVLYFRLQQLTSENKWETIYQGEKIQDMLVANLPKTADTKAVKLIIDQQRGKTAKINSIGLYNETNVKRDSFNTVVYQRIDKGSSSALPSEVLQSDNVDTFAKYYNVYNTVIVFGAVNWNDKGEMSFGDYNGDGKRSEEEFVQEINALKAIVEKRTNRHDVNIVVTALADGAFGGGHDLVNTYMAQHWKSVADQMINFFIKPEEEGGLDLGGLDIDWEYPQSAADWKVYDQFMQYLSQEMKKVKSTAVLTAALSAGALGMDKATLDAIDQIQYMAYDGHDKDGLQSSLNQAQYGLVDFVRSGGTEILKKINIGIAAYGRPVVGGGYWPSWKDVDGANYWDNIYSNILCENKWIADSAFCSPAEAGNKTAYAILSGVGGVMVFRLNCDKLMDDPNAVACGVENALKTYLPNLWGNY